MKVIEDQYIEYKKFVYPFCKGIYDKIKATVCAFLNSHGGTILIGINDYDSLVCGV